jgi:3-methylcrotonyl-CoA carboxylase alpha subunit
MIAKLVTHGPDRASALSALGHALDKTEIAGSTVNTAFLAALAADPGFAAGDVDTGLIGRKQDDLTTVPPLSDSIVAAAALAASGLDNRPASGDPWSALAGYAHFHSTPRRVALKFGEREISVRVGVENGSLHVDLETADGGVRRVRPASGQSALWPGHVTVFQGAAGYTFALPDPLAKAGESGGTGSLRAPMPGLVKLVRAAKGETVAKGQPLLILEAMKMEHTIAAPHDGVIAEIVPEGAQVSDGTVLVRFVEEEG